MVRVGKKQDGEIGDSEQFPRFRNFSLSPNFSRSRRRRLDRVVRA